MPDEFFFGNSDRSLRFESHPQGIGTLIQAGQSEQAYAYHYHLIETVESVIFVILGGDRCGK